MSHPAAVATVASNGISPRYPKEPAPDTGRFGNTHLRWTVVFAALVVGTATLPLWLPALAQRGAAWVTASMLGLFAIMWLSIATGALWNFSKLCRQAARPTAVTKGAAGGRRFRHVVVVPCYLDPIELLFDCLGSLLMQRHREKLVVVVAFERKTPCLEQKIEAVQAAFERRFGDLVISVHTIDRVREIPGGCSNKNYALRQAFKHVSTHHPDFQQTSYTVTTCDTDSLFCPQYFDVLEACYDRENPHAADARQPVRMCVWQPPMFYNWHLDERPFFVRVTGIVRAMMMLGGLISFSLNPMSIFSYPLELGLAAGFINPRYGVDDIIFKVRCMCATNQSVPVVLMPAPVISGPTIGTTFQEEVLEWARQARRWMIGASESFHYFVIHWRGQPSLAAIRWFFMFFMYYAVLLCCAGVFQAIAAVPLPWAMHGGLCATHTGVSAALPVVSLAHVGLAALGLQYLAFGVAFLIDRKAVRLLTVKEQVHWLRNAIHWAVTPLVMLVYQLVTLYAIIKFVFAGKRDAGHIMAAKEGFSSAAPGDQPQAQPPQQQPQPQQPQPQPQQPQPQPQPQQRRQDSDKLAPERCPLERAVSSNSVSFGSAVSGQSLHAEPDRALLCELPQCFYFGSFAFDPQTAGPVGQHTRIYGADAQLLCDQGV